MAGARHKQLYMPDSNILLTHFFSDEGVVEVSDFMPIDALGHAHHLVRRAKTVRGEVRYRMVCEPRFDYGRARHRVEKKKDEVLFISEGEDKTVFRLRSEVPVRVENGAAMAEFTLRSGQSAAFVLEDAARGANPPRPRRIMCRRRSSTRWIFGGSGRATRNTADAGVKW